MTDPLLKETVPIKKQTIRPRVMLICGHEVTADFFKNLFAELGCEPSNAWSPEHAIELFRNYFTHNRPFDLACMDYQLQGMNGITLARHLSAIDSGCLFHMLPCRYQYESLFREDFLDFGGFRHEPGNDMDKFNDLLDIIESKRSGTDK